MGVPNKTLVSCLWATPLACAGAAAPDTHTVLRDSTFEDLANISITTVGRKAQPYLTTPAAIHVITQDDILSTGGLSIPDALRLALGVHVGQIDAHSWAITARGFNSLFADKIVVLVDNRSVYTPLWSGVYWEQREWLADELERIEVVRGPGGSKWGTNAVNGAINIFTRSARDTQGVALMGGAGDEQRAFGSFRYGATLGESGWIRGYAGYKDVDDSALETGAPSGDSWEMARAGFRYDADLSASTLMLQGEVFSSELNQRIQAPLPDPPFFAPLGAGESDGGHLQGIWTLQSARAGQITVQAYYDRSDRQLLSSEEQRDTFDIEAQQQFAFGRSHEVTWGLGYRNSRDEIANNFVVSVLPMKRTLHLWSAFIEDEISPDDSNTSLTLGAKVEHNDFTGWEVQPSVRASWSPDPSRTLWSAVSYAARRPSRINTDLVATNTVLAPGVLRAGAATTLVQNIGSRDLESETVIAYELGFRASLGEYAFDAAAFYNDYDKLLGFDPGTLDTQTLAPQFWRLVFAPQNLGSGHTYGAELAANWRVTPAWSVQFAWSWLQLNLAPSSNRQIARLEGSSPRHTAVVRSSLVLDEIWRLDATARYVDDLPGLDVPDYFTADLSLIRALTPRLELALVGRNLWGPQHLEFRAASIPESTEVERSAFLRLTWRSE